MKRSRIFVVSLLIYTNSFSQDLSKPPIDTSVIRGWPSLVNPGISNDGKYIFYTITKLDIGNRPIGINTLVVQSTDNTWKKEFSGISESQFTEDSKQLIIKYLDTIQLLFLGTNDLSIISNVGSFKCAREWLVYHLNDNNRKLILRNLITEGQREFGSVVSYSFNNDGKVLLLKTEVKEGERITRELRWISLIDSKVVPIWSSGDNSDLRNYQFDGNGNQLAFIIQSNVNGQKINDVWYFKPGMAKAVLKVTDQTSGIDSGLSVSDNFFQFAKNGNWILFGLEQRENRKPKPDAAKVDVWSYRDKILQAAQLKDPRPTTFLACISIESNRIIRLEQENEKALLWGDYFGNKLEEFIIINDNEFGDPLWVESWWNINSPKSYYLISLKDGSKKFITKAVHPNFLFSPKEKYIIYYDRKQKNYFSYDIKVGVTRNISKKISTELCQESDRSEIQDPYPVGVAGWLEDTALLIYDNYDIWQVDPAGKNIPINLTNGFGHIHHVKFRLVYEKDIKEEKLQGFSGILLTAFNTINKFNGFYLKAVHTKGDPKLLTMGPFSYYRVQKTNTAIELGPGDPLRPIRARDNNIWLVQRTSFNEAPNYFLTRDFKNYSALSNIQPHKHYNWLTAELVNWKQFDGIKSQGILYKPENFDPNKKYPIILHYYEFMSDRMYDYLIPDFTQNDLNIPWFVSQGYLVFAPDIYYTIGKTGQSAYNSIVSAAKYLSKYPYVDEKKMALQGHSFGGFETNYVITHSDLFAAASEAAGVVNAISHYGSIREVFGITASYLYETDQSRIGTTLWHRPDLYIENSPIFRINRITTPLLIMHNKNDGNVSWSEGIQLYTAMRRLGKKVWMLQYDDGGHSLDDSKTAKDFTIRLTQFFDHYLKGAPTPIWMSRGIPARLKQIETGYAYDPSGNCGKNCKVCKMWNEKMKKDSVGTMKEIEKFK